MKDSVGLSLLKKEKRYNNMLLASPTANKGYWQLHTRYSNLEHQ